MNSQNILQNSVRISINFRTLITKADASITYAFLRVRNQFTERRGDEFGEKAVVLGLVVIAGIAAWGFFGQKVVTMINETTAGM